MEDFFSSFFFNDLYMNGASDKNSLIDYYVHGEKLVTGQFFKINNMKGPAGVGIL